MPFINLLTEQVIRVPLASNNKAAVLRELVQLLKDAGKIDDFEATLKAVREREDKQSTGLEKGIAVPHGKTAAVTSLVAAIGISKAGIDFIAMDGKPTHLFFLLIAPPNLPGPHVAALAEIAQLSRSHDLCARLINANDAKEALKILRKE